MTESEFRAKFAYYFLDLRDEQRREGAPIDKHSEWDRFVEFHIEEGDIPEMARNWKCPRSLKPWEGRK